MPWPVALRPRPLLFLKKRILVGASGSQKKLGCWVLGSRGCFSAGGSSQGGSLAKPGPPVPLPVPLRGPPLEHTQTLPWLTPCTLPPRSRGLG